MAIAKNVSRRSVPPTDLKLEKGNPMSEDDLMCECGWHGHRYELVCTDDDPDHHIYCPWCERDDGLEAEDSDED